MLIINMLQSIAAVLVGGIIGYGFGIVQDAARRHNERKEAEGKFKSVWFAMPGSGARVAYLLIVLVAVQLICPMLFRDGIQWCVSGGVVLGYGTILFLQMRRRLSGSK